MRILRAFALILVSVLFYQCQKEVSFIGNPDQPNIVLPDPVNAHLQGTVLDENGIPASGVTVKVGSQTTVTDNRGYFRVMNASLDKKSAVVTAEKAGYFKAFRTFAATSGTNQVVIKLIKRTLAGTIDATTGGSVTLSNGAKIEIPANAVMDALDSLGYSGTINVYAAYIDPTAADINQTVPGSFMANDITGSRVIMASYGMMAVELESASAKKLQIKTGSTATLTTPIPSTLLSTAPQTIATWSVNEQNGIWQEEGVATKQGNVYVGDVSHFSFWNCDISVSAVVLSLTLHDQNGNPLAYKSVRITRVNAAIWTETHGWTDSLGQISGYVPDNEPLKLEVLDYCGSPIFTQNISSLNQNTDLGIIVVNISSLPVVTITGSLVDCNGAPVSNGYAMIMYGYQTIYAATDANGNFSTSVTSCASAPLGAEIVGFASVGGQIQSSNIVGASITAPVTAVGTIDVCGTSQVEFFNYTLDGVTYVIGPNPGDSLWATMLVQGSGGQTMLNAQDAPGGVNHIYVTFYHPVFAPGNYFMQDIVVQFNSQVTLQTNATVTITNFANNVGDFYEGSISAQFVSSSGLHNVAGNFRIKRSS